MSLGLSLAVSTNTSQLLVSCPGSQQCPEGRSGDLGLLGSCGEWTSWDKKVEQKKE